jgi:hypothetical protein
MSDRPNIPPPDELAAVRAELKRLETREAELRALLLAEPDVRTGANWVAEVRTVTQERTDLKELRACYPDIVAEQTYPVEIKRIVLMGITEDGEVVSARKFRQETKEPA